MEIKFLRKSGHKFFEFIDSGVSRTVCVDGWINPDICPGFCHPVRHTDWEPLSDDMLLRLHDFGYHYEVDCPTCFGYLGRRGAYRKVGPYHTFMRLDKDALSQYLYNYSTF